MKLGNMGKIDDGNKEKTGKDNTEKLTRSFVDVRDDAERLHTWL